MVAPVILSRELVTQEDLRRIGEVQAAFHESKTALGLVPGYRHLPYIQKKKESSPAHPGICNAKIAFADAQVRQPSPEAEAFPPP